MEHCDGEIPTKVPEISDGGREDRLSALPDDVLIQILIKLLDAAAAARTSVLCSRWRRLWTLLPKLCFRPTTDPHGIRAALESHEAPVLHGLDVGVMDATTESLEVWLPVAACRLSGDLELINTVQQNETDEDPGYIGLAVPCFENALDLPCFEKATSIRLELGNIGLAVPPLGVFARLTNLFLARINLHGPWMLGDAVSSPRCPVLRKLTVHHSCGLGNIAIHSDPLLEIELRHLRGLQQLTIMAPALKHLNVIDCFRKLSSNTQPVANISVPQLESFGWWHLYDPRFTELGKIENLQWLRTTSFFVYGQADFGHQLNSYCLRLLRRFELIQRLSIMLIYLPDIANRRYLMEDITSLPDITHLFLGVRAEGHSFGASAFHVLRLCTGVRRLALKLVSPTRHLEAQTACPSGCVCDQPPNWKTEELTLNCLKEVEVSNLGGTDHEAALVKRVFDWATGLETMTVTFDRSVAGNQAKEFCQMLQSFSRPEICLKGPHFA